MSLALITHPDCLLHEMSKNHPEQPARIEVIENALINSNLYSNIKEYLAPMATQEQLLRVHDADYVDSIFKIAPKENLIALNLDTFMNPYTLNAALRAAGSVVMGVDLVMTQKVKTAFCNVRPPGHHAEKNRAMGFCIFNNIAVGVAHALANHKLKRVAIIDFDVHHGNGTENIFWDDNRVLLCSFFQHPFYPFCGFETKSDHIINLPLPVGSTGQIFQERIQVLWLNSIQQFNPEMIFFSAGFDGHEQDEMSDILLKEEDYAWLSEEIKRIADRTCQGRIVSVLEGGYELKVLGKCVIAHLRALLSNDSK